MGVVTAWRTSTFVPYDGVGGTTPGEWVGVTTIGNGSATVRSRRQGGLFLFSINVTIGSTTVLVPGEDWYFHLPSDIGALFNPTGGSARLEPVPCNARLFTASIYADGVGHSVSQNASVLVVPQLGGARIQKTVPGAWAAGDYLLVSGWMESIDN